VIARPPSSTGRAFAASAEAVLTAPNEQLEGRGLFIKAGMMLDATLVETEVRRPPMRASRVTRRPWSRTRLELVLGRARGANRGTPRGADRLLA
jgi:hypothetical protein